MRSIKQWQVDVFVGENDGRTYAEASLVTDLGDRLVGTGWATVASSDHDVPEIGDEVATARALASLATRLLGTASHDIEQVTGEHVHLAR